MKSSHSPQTYCNQYHSQGMNLKHKESRNFIAKSDNSTTKTQPHNQDLFCFQCCSNWNLELTTSLNKDTISSFNLMGKSSALYNDIISDSRSLPNDLIEYLPIDLMQHQRFVLDPGMQKINLNLIFTFNGELTPFTVISQYYSQLLFEINLFGELHGMQMTKEPINFRVKGYDIIRSIQNVLNDNRVNLSDVIFRDHMMTVFNVTVFSNIQCSFSVEFDVSNFNLSNYYSAISQYGYNKGKQIPISQYGMVITKLKITYYLPVCVFSYQNINAQMVQMIPTPIISHHFQQMQPLLSLRLMTGLAIPNQIYYLLSFIKRNQYINNNNVYNINNDKGSEYINYYSNISNNNCNITSHNYHFKQQEQHLHQQQQRQTRHNVKISMKGYITNAINTLSNWKLFIKYISPLIFPKYDVKLIHIFQSFIRPGLFGITCMYNFPKQNITEVIYFPSLSSIYINKSRANMNSDIASPSFSSISYSNPKLADSLPSLDYDENSLTNNTSILQDDHTYSPLTNKSNKSINKNKKEDTIYYLEQGREIFNMSVISEQIKSFVQLNNKVEVLKLNDITSDSYFSIIWTPSKIIKENNYSMSQHKTLQNLPSIKVYYKFRDKALAYKPQPLTVIGLVENNIRGETINPPSQLLSDFWFLNSDINSGFTPLTNTSDQNDKLSYIYLIEKGYEYSLKDHQATFD